MKSMKDCRTQEEKDKLVKDVFNGVGLEPLEPYKNAHGKILCRVIDKNDQYFGRKVRMSFVVITRGNKWRFDALDQEEKDQIMRNMFLNMGTKVDENYHYLNTSDHIPYTVINKNSEYYGLKGEMSLSKVKCGNKWSWINITKEDKIKYSKTLFNNIGLKLIDTYSNTKTPMLFEVIDSDDSNFIGLKGKITYDSLREHNSWDTRSLLPEEFKKYVDRVCEPLQYEVIKYPKCKKDRLVVCTKSGNIWDTLLDRIVRCGNRCPFDTSASFGERVINELFKLNKINFEYQKTIHHQDKSRQYIDFYLPDYNGSNICIEYNGIQHYEGTSVATNKEDSLIYIQRQDLKKYRYCKSHNIEYCEIPYIYDSIETITKYVEDKILHVPLIRPSDSSVQYSKIYNDEEVIDAYKKYQSSNIVADKLNITQTIVLGVIHRHDIKTSSDKKPVVQLSKDDHKIINIFESAHAPIKLLNKKNCYVNIAAVCRNERSKKSAYGYKWMYLSDYLSTHPDFSDADISTYMVANN